MREVKFLSHQNLNKSTLETIINEIFSTDVNENEHLIKNFKDEYELQIIFFFILEKNSKMNNQVFIPSNGNGELYLDVFDMH